MTGNDAPTTLSPSKPHCGEPCPGSPVSVWTVLYWAAAFGLAVFNTAMGSFGLIDDQFLFKPELIHGHWRLLWGDPSGRFYPLCGREFLVLRELGLLSAPLFYAIQSLKLLASAFFAKAILERSGAGPRTCFIMLLLVFGSPAFMVSVSRLFVAELTPFTLILAALWLLGDERGGWRRGLGVLLAAAAMYHKETVFLALGTMGAALVLLPGGVPGRRAAGAWLVAASGVFVAAYLAFGLAYMEAGGYTAGRTLGLPATAWYFARNDLPLAAMLLLGVWRCLAEARRGRPAAFETACLAGGLAYAGAFLVLRIASPWYLLPAYAFVLPALPGAVDRLARPLPPAARAAAFCAVLAASLAWSLAGYSFMNFNHCAARGLSQFLAYLKDHAPPQGSMPVPLNLPRLDKHAEPALNIPVFLASDGLSGAFRANPVSGEDIWSALKDRPGLTAVTPYTRISHAEQNLLDACRETLLATPAPAGPPVIMARLFGLESPEGSRRGTLAPAGAWRVFGQGVYDPGSRLSRGGEAPPRCPLGFEWTGFSASTPVRGVKVCPMTGGVLPVRLTNATRWTFIREEADPGGGLGVTLFTAKPGGAPRVIGFHPLPMRLEPGESAELEIPFPVFTYEPGVIGVTIGSVSGQELHSVLPAPLLVSNYLPRFGVCWN